MTETFAHKYCCSQRIPTEDFYRVLLKQCLHPQARFLLPIIHFINPVFFQADFVFLDCISRIRTHEQLIDESHDFRHDRANRTSLRRWFRLRVSIARVQTIVRPLL